MRTAGLQPGDVVEVDVLGTRFEAEVENVEVDAVQVKPLPRWATWRRVRPRQVRRRIRRQERLV